MKYFIHIDESGGFGEGIKTLVGNQSQRASAVAGLCSRLDHSSWKTVHQDLVAHLNEKNATDFQYPEDFHCSPMRMGSLAGTETIPETIRRQFTEDVFHNVLQHASFGLISINTPARFEFSRQATYGVNLVAALKASLLHLAQHTSDCTAIEVVIAQRSIGETRIADNDPTTYMQDLLPFLRDQLISGRDDGVKLGCKLSDAGTLLLRADKATSDAGLMAADFVCLARTEKYLRCYLAVSTSPNDILFGDYQAFYQVEVRRLVESQQYAAAICIARRSLHPSEAARQSALNMLKNEHDAEILGRELPALLAETRLLIEKRTIEPGALVATRQILESLISIAQTQLSGALEPPVKRRWADILVNALIDLATCHNHVGETEAQAKIEEALQRALADHGNLISSTYHQKKEILLEARTRNLNVLFNDYRFAEVIDSFEEEVRRREAEIPSNVTDELLGKMLGSLGQACAFLARTDPEWVPMARDYFERSKRQFAPGIPFQSMAVNYLTTLAFQERQLEQACREMSAHTNLLQIGNPTVLADNLHDFITQENASVFDAVNYLRIASLCCEQGGPVTANSLELALRHWRPLIQSAHPHEQLCKWFAYLFYLAGSPSRASELCERGVQICETLGFTVQTISLSIIGLNAICQTALNNPQGCVKQRYNFEKLTQTLAGKSKTFDAYLQTFGGSRGLLAIVDKQDRQGAAEICRFPPFAYM